MSQIDSGDAIRKDRQAEPTHILAAMPGATVAMGKGTQAFRHFSVDAAVSLAFASSRDELPKTAGTSPARRSSLRRSVGRRPFGICGPDSR